MSIYSLVSLVDPADSASVLEFTFLVAFETSLPAESFQNLLSSWRLLHALLTKLFAQQTLKQQPQRQHPEGVLQMYKKFQF